MFATIRRGSSARQRVLARAVAKASDKSRIILPASSEAAASLHRNRGYSNVSQQYPRTKLLSRVQLENHWNHRIISDRILVGAPVFNPYREQSTTGRESNENNAAPPSFAIGRSHGSLVATNHPFDSLMDSNSSSSSYQLLQRAHYHSHGSTQRRSFATSAKIPTPEPPPEPQGIKSRIQNFDAKEMTTKALTMTWNILKTVLIFLLKTPGNIIYFATHGKERREKIAEIREAAKKEFDHYWMGTKLLMADVRTARNLLARTLSGSTLTRRERKQLLRTVSDLFRLVPFSMFLIIPFMEFALPFALRIFPNMLPSTFQDSLKAEESMKRELQSRIAMAQFFQETLKELAKEQKRIAAKKKSEGKDSSDESSTDEMATKQEESAASMLEFLDRARSGEMLPPDVIIQYANYFKDDMTLDNMPRMQLINMCKYMNIPPYGADAFLRFQLRHRIRTLKEDDQRIIWEGIESLTKMELREACQERGMRSTGLSKDTYRRSLQQWLDLSVNKDVPISLLIMSRTFFLQEEISAPSIVSDPDTKSVAGLADAISGLDKEVLNEVILQVATSEEKKSDPEVRKIKLEILEQQNEKIRQEQAEREAAAAKKKDSAASEESKVEEAVADEKAKTVQTSDKVEHTLEATTEAVDVSSGTVDEPEKERSTEEDTDTTLSTAEMEAISQLLSADPVSKEREELERIKNAMKEDGEMDKLEAVKHLEELVDGENVPVEDENDLGKEQLTLDPNKLQDISDEVVGKIVKEAESLAEEEASKSTSFSTTSEDSQTSSLDAEMDTTTHDISSDAADDEEEEEEDPIVARLKRRVESMVDKIEVQLSDVQVKIGDKLHMLDKDMDGILTTEEIASVLQQVLKRKISAEEALEIASEMDENKDGVFTAQELIDWIQTNRLVKFVEEGSDAELDRIMESHSSSESSHPSEKAEETPSSGK